jgi:endonuclease/exonuclease/phosphatase (EEP) superfamily protein YafD
MIVLPLVPLVPLVIWLRPRWSAVALVVASFSSVSVSAFNVPWWNLAHDPIEPEQTLRLLTCNVQGKDLRIRDLVGLIRDERPDIVLLEECSVDLYKVLRTQEGWHVRLRGDYCIASRYPIAEFEPLFESEKKRRIVAVRAKIHWSGRLIPVVAVHFMTPRSGLEAIACSPLRGLDSFRQIAAVQRLESGRVRSWVERNGSSLILAGDLNLTAEHPVYRRDWSAYANAFSSTGWGLGHTMVVGNTRLRLDHVLYGSEWRATRCWVGPEVGSDHRPIVAELGWEG